MQKLIRAAAAALLVLSQLCCPSQAQQEAYNSLTPAEKREGTLLLFDGETTFGWAARGNAAWRAENGMLVSDSGGQGMLATTTEFTNYQLHAEVWIDAQTNSGIFLRCPTEGEITPYNSYEVNIYDPHPKWPTGSINEVGRTTRRVTSVGRWTSFDITAAGDRLTVVVDGAKTLDRRNSRSNRGCIALQRFGEGTVRFRNIRLKPLGAQSIFNGRDLTGWTVVPDHKSVFSVTKEGWLNVKNGNGEIQTQDTWADFLFQGEVISNGEHLNSGIFFRSEPGKFWLGYECQIRNQWQGDDRTKPVDYGTGGIYNRQPARRVVSTDHTWFTVTIVAHNRHIATWIDGIQVADFTDTRPENQSNARQGARTTAGSITIQGHDPTTDLSFRRLRVQSYPGRKP
jgi:hypothetical protein